MSFPYCFQRSSPRSFPHCTHSPLWMMPAEWQCNSPSTICRKISRSMPHSTSRRPPPAALSAAVGAHVAPPLLRATVDDATAAADPFSPEGDGWAGWGPSRSAVGGAGSMVWTLFFSHTSSVTPGTASIEMYRMYGHLTASVPPALKRSRRPAFWPAAAAVAEGGCTGDFCPRLRRRGGDEKGTSVPRSASLPLLALPRSDV